jgi:hypothetical protein
VHTSRLDWAKGMQWPGNRESARAAPSARGASLYLEDADVDLDDAGVGAPPAARAAAPAAPAAPEAHGAASDAAALPQGLGARGATSSNVRGKRGSFTLPGGVGSLLRATSVSQVAPSAEAPPRQLYKSAEWGQHLPNGEWLRELGGAAGGALLSTAGANGDDEHGDGAELAGAPPLGAIQEADDNISTTDTNSPTRTSPNRFKHG